MQEIYDQTVLTPLKVARSVSFIDWRTQPEQFKSYPDFLFRYPFNEIDALKVIEYARCITDYQIIGGKPYYRLNTPSAGNLHPIELYVQIRGIKGVISGIYHVAKAGLASSSTTGSLASRSGRKPRNPMMK
jgi:hypothetical protein